MQGGGVEAKGTKNLDGYTSYRNDRADGYGGAMLYIKIGVEHRACHPLNTKGFDNSVWCWIIEKE